MNAIGRLIIVAFSFCILLNSCAPARYVKPLKKKQQAVSFTFGGPLIKFAGAPIPIPFSSLGYGYGLRQNLTLFGNLHTTSLLFGNLQTDIGATLLMFEKEKHFGVSLSPALQCAYHIGTTKSFRLWPSCDLNAYYHPGAKASYIYTGFNSWFELSGVKAHDEAITQRMIPSINTGYVIVKEKWQHQFQLSYFAPGHSIYPGVVDYIGISGKGALGLHYALFKKF